jgi:hypothetical protein
VEGFRFFDAEDYITAYKICVQLKRRKLLTQSSFLSIRSLTHKSPKMLKLKSHRGI